MDGGGGLFDGYGAGYVWGEQDGEDSDSGVGVNEGVGGLEAEAVAGYGDEVFGLGGVDLEEGGGGDFEVSAEHIFDVMLLAGRDGDIGVLERGLNEQVAGVRADPEGHIGRFGGSVLELGERVVYDGVHEHTMLNSDEAAGYAVGESELAASSDGESGVVAVVEGAGGGQRGIDSDGGEVLFVAGEMALDDAALEGELGVVGYVLPLAAGAGAGVSTPGGNAVGGRLQDPGYDAGYYLFAASAVAVYAGDDALARDSAGDVDDAGLEFGGGVAEFVEGAEGELGEFRGGVSVVVSGAAAGHGLWGLRGCSSWLDFSAGRGGNENWGGLSPSPQPSL